MNEKERKGMKEGGKDVKRYYVHRCYYFNANNNKKEDEEKWCMAGSVVRQLSWRGCGFCWLRGFCPPKREFTSEPARIPVTSYQLPVPFGVFNPKKLIIIPKNRGRGARVPELPTHENRIND